MQHMMSICISNKRARTPDSEQAEDDRGLFSVEAFVPFIAGQFLCVGYMVTPHKSFNKRADMQKSVFILLFAIDALIAIICYITYKRGSHRITKIQNL